VAKILVVEDQAEMAGLVSDWLSAQGHLIDCADTGASALTHLKVYEYDLIVLDVNLPVVSGIDVLRTFRQHGGKTPVIMLTGNRTIDDKESGFEAGADDYLTKPFHMRELTARVKAILKRAGGNLQGESITLGALALYPSQHRLTVSGEDVNLLPKEFALLEFLMRHQGQVFSAEALLKRVWPSDADATGSTLRSHITRIRSKLHPNPSIITVHGVGYKI